MPISALDVYQAAQRATATGRQLEAALLFKSARQLETVVTNWESAERQTNLPAALEYNTRLWAVFHASMEDPESQLPRELRVNVLLLVRCIDRRTLDILTSPAPGKLQMLIDINRQVAMGLSVAESTSPEATAVGTAA